MRLFTVIILQKVTDQEARAEFVCGKKERERKKEERRVRVLF